MFSAKYVGRGEHMGSQNPQLRFCLRGKDSIDRVNVFHNDAG